MLVKIQSPGSCPRDSGFMGLSSTQGFAFFIVTQVVFKPHLRSTELELTVCSRDRVKIKLENEIKPSQNGPHTLYLESGLYSMG